MLLVILPTPILYVRSKLVEFSVFSVAKTIAFELDARLLPAFS